MASNIAAPSGKKTFQADFITQLNHNDVLCGRGSGANFHIGNVNFRKLVLSRKAEYSTSSRRRKACIAEEIVSILQNKQPRGRFLKKVDDGVLQDSGFDHDAEAWCLIADNVALEKAKQAMRQNKDMRLLEDEVRQKRQEIQCQEQREITYLQDEYCNRKDSDRSGGETVYASGSCPQQVCTNDPYHITKGQEKCNDQMSRLQQSQKYNHPRNWLHQEQFPFAFGDQGK